MNSLNFVGFLVAVDGIIWLEEFPGKSKTAQLFSLWTDTGVPLRGV